MEILSTGHKIKKLRKELGLKQDDITRDEVTRSLISMVENNKRALSWNTAKIISDCLNQYYKNLGKVITPEFLMETEVDQAKNIIIEQIEVVRNSLVSEGGNKIHLHQSIDWLVNLALEWDIKKEMADLFILRGEVYYYSTSYNEALKNFVDALQYYLTANDFQRVAQIYNLIGMCNHALGNINQGLMYFLKAYDTALEHPHCDLEEIKMLTVFNIIRCFNLLKKYDMAFQFIKTFKELDYYDDKHYDQVLLMEANTYRDLQNYSKAERIYDKLLNRGNKIDSETLYLTFENISHAYKERGDLKKALFYINDAFNFENIFNSELISKLYLSKAKCLVKLESLKEAEEALEKGLEIAKKILNYDLIVEFYFIFAKINRLLKETEAARLYLKEGERLIFEHNLKLKTLKLYSYYAELYHQIGDGEKCFEYISKLRGVGAKRSIF